MTVKASLRVLLLANEVTVAESDDPSLWQYNLAAITGGRLPPESHPGGKTLPPTQGVLRPPDRQADAQHTNDRNGNGGAAGGGIERFAEQLRVDIAVLEAACDPSSEPPYMHLDLRAWQEFKRNTAARGTSSVPPVVMAATLLVLWFPIASLGAVTINQAQAVLGTIDARDKNPARGLRNCNWLQTRDDVIRLNPTRFNMALAVARAYCNQQAIEEV